MIRPSLLVLMILLVAGCITTVVENGLVPSDLITLRSIDTEDGPMVQIETSVATFRAKRLSFVDDDESSEIVASANGLTMTTDDRVLKCDSMVFCRDSLNIGGLCSFRITAQP